MNRFQMILALTVIPASLLAASHAEATDRNVLLCSRLQTEAQEVRNKLIEERELLSNGADESDLKSKRRGKAIALSSFCDTGNDFFGVPNNRKLEKFETIRVVCRPYIGQQKEHFQFILDLLANSCNFAG